MGGNISKYLADFTVEDTAEYVAKITLLDAHKNEILLSCANGCVLEKKSEEGLVDLMDAVGIVRECHQRRLLAAWRDGKQRQQRLVRPHSVFPTRLRFDPRRSRNAPLGKEPLVNINGYPISSRFDQRLSVANSALCMPLLPKDSLNKIKHALSPNDDAAASNSAEDQATAAIREIDEISTERHVPYSTEIQQNLFLFERDR